MAAWSAIRTVRRTFAALWRRGRSPAEFRRVNALTGLEPLRPALSGLRIRYPAGYPAQMARRLVDLRCRWNPSSDYRRRQDEMQAVNWTLKQRRARLKTLPPISLYRDEDQITPSRIQPLLHKAREPAEDAKLDWLGRAQLLSFSIPTPAADSPAEERPLIPRRYRQFLRASPYPQAAAILLLLGLVAAGAAWVSQVQHAEAIAAGRFHVARHAFQSELSSARAYGVGTAALAPLAREAGTLSTMQAPPSLLPTRSREYFFRRQAREYRALLRRVRLLERRALKYWRWRERRSYLVLVNARAGAAALGVVTPPSPVAPCRTPRCFRRATVRQHTAAAWLRETAATLKIYAAAIVAAPDPATAAGQEIGEAHNLAALLPPSTNPPARLADLDGRMATAGSMAQYGQIGALAHLDVDALQSDLVRSLPPRVVLVSVEEQQMTVYLRRKAIYRAPVAAGAETPTGLFHIQAKERSVSALLWSSMSRSARYRTGSLLDWMPFSGDAALQGAPWRTVFGPASAGLPPAYAPDTPASIDLPPGAADFVFRWAPAGTDVMVY